MTRALDDAAYQKVRAATEELVRDATKASRDTWKLADSVAAVPVEALPDLATRLEADGALTPRGEPYSVEALARLRADAIAWPPEERHHEAAHRTHQEAGGPRTDGGVALAALCAVARGEKPKRPTVVERDRWDVAVSQVKKARGRRGQWLVSANALRVAMGRSTNVPGGLPGKTAVSRMASQQVERESAERRRKLGLPPIREMGATPLQDAMGAMQLLATIKLATEEVRQATKLIDAVTPESATDIEQARKELAEAVADLTLALNGTEVTDDALVKLLEDK